MERSQEYSRCIFIILPLQQQQKRYEKLQHERHERNRIYGIDMGIRILTKKNISFA